MQVTLLLAMLGAVIPGSAFGEEGLFWTIVLIGRTILGVGVGGIYPLSAVKSAEGSTDNAKKGKRVGMAFFGQAVGQASMYVVALVLISVINSSVIAAWIPQCRFRMLFILGALPAAIVFLMNMR